jgi:hypothetical protein
MTRHNHTLCIATCIEALEHAAGKCSPHSPMGCCWPPPGHRQRMLRVEKHHPELKVTPLGQIMAAIKQIAEEGK